MGYITDDGLIALKNYKYISGGYSFMDKIMNHWWEFFVKLIPMVSQMNATQEKLKTLEGKEICPLISSRISPSLCQWCSFDHFIVGCSKPDNTYRTHHQHLGNSGVLVLWRDLQSAGPTMGLLLCSHLRVLVSNVGRSRRQAGEAHWYVIAPGVTIWSWMWRGVRVLWPDQLPASGPHRHLMDDVRFRLLSYGKIFILAPKCFGSEKRLMVYWSLLLVAHILHSTMGRISCSCSENIHWQLWCDWG